MKMNLLLILTFGLLTTGCAGLFPERSFLAEMERDSEGFFTPGRDFPVVNGDSGEAYRSREEIAQRTPASERTQKIERERLSIREELAMKESQLSENEYARYRANARYLETDSDKIYYLSLTSSEREQYISGRKEAFNEGEYKNYARQMIDKRSIRSSELTMGMDKQTVRRLWGPPSKVDFAGDPRYENELWYFYEDGSVKKVFFEGGQVNGWSIQ